jgi:hypothetical protein
LAVWQGNPEIKRLTVQVTTIRKFHLYQREIRERPLDAILDYSHSSLQIGIIQRRTEDPINLDPGQDGLLSGSPMIVEHRENCPTRATAD